MNMPRSQDKPTQFLPNVNRSPDALAGKKFASINHMAKSIRYKTDGSGRDSYCTTGDGGFTNPNRVIAVDPRVVFARTLRGYEQDGDYLARRNQRMQMKKQMRNFSNITGNSTHNAEGDKKHSNQNQAVTTRDRQNSVDHRLKALELQSNDFMLTNDFLRGTGSVRNNQTSMIAVDRDMSGMISPDDKKKLNEII